MAGAASFVGARVFSSRIATDSPLWDWASVAVWLFRNKKLARDEVIVAEAVRAANDAIEAGEVGLGPRLRQTVHAFEAALRGHRSGPAHVSIVPRSGIGTTTVIVLNKQRT